MKNATATLLAAAAMLVATAAAADALHDMRPYPEPADGMQRLVFRVPALPDEADRKVEILAGRTIEVDCNRARFMGSLERHVAEGWGYPYYVVPAIVGPASTLMACPEGQAKRAEFVSAGGDDFFVRYNSKLPVVVYVPAGFEVRYRIWAPQGETGRAEAE